MGEGSIGQGLASKGSQNQPSIDDVVQMLKQGMQPEELVQSGIPVELIKAAIQMLMQEMGQAGGMQPQTTPAAQPEGLAGARVQSVDDMAVRLLMEGEGLAAQGVTNTYGDGKDNTIKSAYGGLIEKQSKKPEDKSKTKETDWKTLSGIRG